MGLPPIKTRPKIDLSSLPILEIPEPKEAPKKEPSLREGIDLSALNLDKKQVEAPEGIDLSSLGGYFKQAAIPEGPEYQAPPIDPGDESIGATLDRMLAQTTTAIPTAVRGGAELLRKGIVDPLIAPVEGLSPEHGKSLHKLFRQPLLDLEQLAAEKQQGAKELFEKTVKPASSKPITYKSLKDAPVETLHRALNRVIENAPTTIGQLAVTAAAPILGFGLNAAIETGSTAASIDALEAEGVKVNPEYKETINTVAGITKAIPDFFSDRLLLKILGSRAGFLPKLVMTALESFTEGSTEGVQNLVDVAAEQGATLTPEEVKNFGKYVNDTFNLAKINPGAAAAYLGINVPRRLLGRTPAEQALNLMRTEEATIVGGLAGGLYAAPGLLNTGGEQVTGEQLTPDGIRKALASGQPVTQPAPKIDLSALGLPSGSPRGLLQEGFASRPAEPREFIAGPGESEIVTALRSKPNLIPPDVDAAVMDRTLALEEAGATQEQMMNDPILKELDQLSREVYSGKVAPPKYVVRQRMSAEPTIGTGRQVTTQERVIPKRQLEQATETPVEAPAETQAEVPVEQKPQQTVTPKTTVRKPATPAQKSDGAATSANFKEAIKIARASFIASKGKPADVQFKEAAAALKAANVHPVIIDEITNPDRFSRPGEPGEKSDATTRRGRYERAVAPPKELQPGLNRITDAASDFNKAKADYEAAKTDLLGILKQRGVEIITADDGVTPKDIRVLKGKTNLSPAAQRVIKDAIQEAAQKGGFSAETVGQGFQMSVTPVKAFPGERLQGNTFAEQLSDFLKKHKAVKNAEAIFKRAKNSSFDALVDDYLAKRVEGKEGSAYRGEGRNNQAEIYVRRKLSASDPDIEPFRSQIKGLRKKLTSEETQRGADYLTVTKTSGASRVRIAEGEQERIMVPKEPAVVREEQPAYKAKREIPDTITVDGKERPTRNSKEQLIHPTLRGVENFWKWFGDSKVVDKQGRPLVVYHGTTARKVEVLTKSFEAGSGIFLTDNEDVADTFTLPREYGEPVFEDERGRPIKPGDTVVGYLKIENPFVLPKNDAQRFVDDTAYQVEVLREAKAAGNDGVIANDVKEGIGERFKSTNYVVWSSNQVKSIRNRGAFGPTELNILKEEQPEYKARKLTKKDLAPIWYSQMERTLEQKLPNSGTPESFLQIIEGFQKKGEFKREEIEWIGLKEWLANRKGKATKQQVLEFVHENRIQIKEITKSGSQLDAAFLFDTIDFSHNPEDYGYDEDTNEMQYTIVDLTSEQQGYYDVVGENVKPSDGSGDFDVFFNGKEKIGRVYDILDAVLLAKKDNQERFGGIVKYETYQLPGGENYKELLLTLLQTTSGYVFRTDMEVAMRKKYGDDFLDLMTEKESKLFYSLPVRVQAIGDFRSVHFDEPNILAHVRFNERKDSDGKRVLFIEEIQSDWHQRGRKEGYKTKVDTEGWTAEKGAETPDGQIFFINDKTGKFINSFYADSEFDAIRKAAEWEEKKQDRVPRAPFKTSWYELVMKRMLRYAAENGFERMAWTTGEQQAERYDLSKQVDTVFWTPESRHLFVEGKDGSIIFDEQDVSDNRVADVVGKELAEKLFTSETNDNGDVELSGLDLKVGGEGMKGFYDKILPQFMNKYGKKWGAKVGETYLAPTEDTKLLANDDAEKAAAIGAAPVHSIEITPAMRDAVLTKGQALFEQQPPYEPSYKKRPDASEKTDKWAREIVDGLAKGRKQGRVILANAINNQFRNDSTADLIGQDIRTSDDVAVLAQVFRNPKTETMRYVLVKDGKAVHMTGVTSRLPSSTAIFPYADTAEGLAWLDELMALHKADSYYIIHNHPSGNATASPDDVKQTETIAKGVKGFKGHVIVDSNEYTVIDLSFRPAKQVRNFGEDALLTPSLDHPVLGTKVDSNEVIADIAKKLQTPKGWATLIGTSKGRVRSIMEVEEGQLSNPKKAAAIARRFATQTGSANIYLHTSDQFWNDNLTTLTKGIKEGFIIDAVSEKGNSADEWLAERTSVFGKERVTKQFGKEAPAGKVVGEASAVTTETIKVDGKERSTRNSKGQLIHPTKEGIENFWKWFKDSEVMDKQGRPLVVYHGTNADFTSFSAEASSSKTGNPSAQLGFYFSTDHAEASRYARDWGTADGRVIPAMLSISNPYEMPYREFDDLAMAVYRTGISGLTPLDAQGRPTPEVRKRLAKADTDARAAALARKAELIAAGYDGIVVNRGKATEEWIAFSPTQIKSAIGNRGTFSPTEPSIVREEQPKLKNKLFDHLTKEERAELEASFKESEEAFKNIQARLDFGLFDSKLQKNFILASKAVLKALSRAAKSSFVKFGDWSKEMVKLYGQKISSYLTPLWNAITPTSLNIGDEVFINGRPIRVKSKLNHHGSNAINNTQSRAPNHVKRLGNILFEVVADDYADAVKPLNSALADRMRKIADAYKLFDGRIRHAVNLTELEKRIRDARFNWTKNLFQGDSPTANLENVYFDEHGNGYTALTQIITDPVNNTPDNLTELEKDIVKTYRKILDIAKTLHKRFGLVDSELEDIPNKPRVALTYEAKDAIYTTKEASPLYQAIVNGLAKANRTQDVKSFKLKAEDVIARRVDGEWEVRSTQDREWQEVDDPQAINRLERAWVRDTLETRGIGIFETFPNYVTLDDKPVPITANNVFDALSALSAETAKISALAREFGPKYRQFLTREQELLRDKGLNTKPITDWLDAYFNRRPAPERFIQSRGSAIGSIRRFGRLIDTTIKTAALSASAPLQFPSVLMALHLTGYKPFFKGAADTFRAVVNRKGIAELAAMGAVHREVYNFSIKKGEIFEDMANAIRQTGGRTSFLQQGNKFQSYFTAFGMQAFADQLIKQGGKLSRDQVATLVSLDFTADDLKKIRAGEMKKGDSLYSAIVGRSVRYVTGEGLTGGENSRFLRSPMAQLLFPFSRWPVLQMKRFSKEYQIAKKLLRQGDYKTWFNRTARLFGGAVLAGELQFLLGAMLFGTTMKDAWERPDEEMWERLMNDLLAGAILGPFSRLAWIALQSEQTAERIAASATFWGNIAYDVVNMLTDSHEFANQTTWEKSARLLRKRLPAMKYVDGFRQNIAVLGLGKANDLEYRALKNLRRKWLEENDLGTSYDRRGYRESTVQFRKIYERLVEGEQDINEILGDVLKVKEQELLDKAIKEGRETRGIDEQDAIRSLKASLRFRKFFVIDGKDMSEAQLAGFKAFIGEGRYAQMAAHDKLIDELIDSLGTTSRARRRR